MVPVRPVIDTIRLLSGEERQKASQTGNYQHSANSRMIVPRVEFAAKSSTVKRKVEKQKKSPLRERVGGAQKPQRS